MFINNSVDDVNKVLPFKDPSFTDEVNIPSILLEKTAGEMIFSS